MLCSFTSFAGMRPKNFALANFANRRTSLCTQHQNCALKLKMLRKYTGIPTNPEASVKYKDQKISSIVGNIKQQDFTRMTFGKRLKLCTRAKYPKKSKGSPKPSVMLNSLPSCKRIQRNFAAILAGLQCNSETAVPQRESSTNSCLHSNGFFRRL